MRHLTIRDVPSDLARRLEAEKRARGRSLNQTVLELLAQALGVTGGRRSNGLRTLAGTWEAAEIAEVESAIQLVEELDSELWR